MSTIEMHETTKSSPEQYTAALTDFSARPFDHLRQQRRRLLEGARTADRPRRCHRGCRRRLGTSLVRLDRSQPRRRQDDRLEHLGRCFRPHLPVHAESRWHHRDQLRRRARGKNFKGRFLGIVLGSVGKSKLVKAFRNSVKAVEARDYPAKSPQS